MEQEEYIVDGHKVTHSVHLGDREIFLAVQQDAPLPFYVGYMEVSYELGLARFSGIEAQRNIQKPGRCSSSACKSRSNRSARSARNTMRRSS